MDIIILWMSCSIIFALFSTVFLFTTEIKKDQPLASTTKSALRSLLEETSAPTVLSTLPPSTTPSDEELLQQLPGINLSFKARNKPFVIKGRALNIAKAEKGKELGPVLYVFPDNGKTEAGTRLFYYEASKYNDGKVYDINYYKITEDGRIFPIRAPHMGLKASDGQDVYNTGYKTFITLVPIDQADRFKIDDGYITVQNTNNVIGAMFKDREHVAWDEYMRLMPLYTDETKQHIRKETNSFLVSWMDAQCDNKALDKVVEEASKQSQDGRWYAVAVGEDCYHGWTADKRTRAKAHIEALRMCKKASKGDCTLYDIRKRIDPEK